MTSILVIINLISVSAMRASLLLLAVLAVLASSQASSISEVLVKEQWEVSPGSMVIVSKITSITQHRLGKQRMGKNTKTTRRRDSA